MPIRTAFIVLGAYPVIVPRTGAEFGGREARAWLLARGLARCPGFEVSFVVDDHGQAPAQAIAGVKVVRKPSWWHRLGHAVRAKVRRVPALPWLQVRGWDRALAWQLPAHAAQVAARRVSARIRRLLLAPTPRPDPFYNRIESDVTCCFGADAVSATVTASALAAGGKLVFFVASDADLDPRYAADSRFVNAYGQPASLCYYPLAHADLIVAQTERQRRLLADRFRRAAVVVENPVEFNPEVPPRDEDLDWLGTSERFALWVGRADSFHKRADLALELARRCPLVPFVLVMQPLDARLAADIHRHRPTNMRVVDAVAHRHMPRVYHQAAVLVSTSASRHEGFPNTFLEAAAAGVPIASLEVDPQDFVREQGCGEVAGGDLEALARFVQRVWDDPVFARSLGERGRAYVREHHALDDKARQLARVLTELVGNTSCAASAAT